MFEVTNRKNNKKQKAWVANEKYVNNGYKFLMCHYSKQQHKVINFSDQFYDFHVMDGEESINLIKIGRFRFYKYFQPLIQFFEKHNMEYTIFSYDWRQCLFVEATRLNEYIMKNNFNNITIIAHSLGNNLMDTYMRMFPFNSIKKYIAISPPYNGTSYLPQLMLIKGYDMGIPLPLSICKQIQLNGALMSELLGESYLTLYQKKDIQEKEMKDLINWNDVTMKEINYYSPPFEICRIMKQEKYPLNIEQFEILQSFCKKGEIVHEKIIQKKQRDLFIWLEEQLQKKIKTDNKNIDFEKVVYNSKDIVELSKKIYPYGTILGFLYQINSDMVEQMNKIKQRQIFFPKDFQIYIIGGYGIKSYKNISIYGVNDFQDIPYLDVKLEESIGDGTVLVENIIRNDYPKEVIKECVIKKDMDHTKILHSNYLQEKIMQWINQ